MSFLEDKKGLEALLHAHDTGLSPIEPHWVRNTTEADFQAGEASWLEMWQSNTDFREKTWSFLREGLVLADVTFAQLLPALDPEYSDELKEGEYINRRALKILNHWRDRTPLTAPCCALNYDSSKVQVYAGNHRTNSALRLAAPRIHLLIPKAQLPRFYKLLGDFPSYDQPLLKFTKPVDWWESTASPETDS